jgi:hypothetical protein
VHLNALDPIEEPEHRAPHGQRHDCIAHEPVPPVRLPRPVTAEPHHERRRLLHEDVPDHVRVFARERRVLPVRADQLKLVVLRALNPIIIDLISLGA